VREGEPLFTRCGQHRMHTEALITVAICTYNRHEHLKRLLPLLAEQTLSGDLYKIIIVDNSDDSRASQAFSRQFSEQPNLSILESSPPGLSRARNVALEACATRYIAYLDDDASPKPEWLSATVRAFATHDPAIVAGPIYPVWTRPAPDWLPPKYVGCLTILDHGPNDRWLSGNEFAYGANMSFKADMLREVGGFNVALDRRGGHILLSEGDIEPQLKAYQLGHKTFYAASAGVDHLVPPDRLTRNYFRARMAWQAVSALMRDPPLRHFDWSQHEIRTAAEKLGLSEFISKLMTHRDADTFSSQLDIIYHLFAVLLESKDLDDLTVESTFMTPAGTANTGLPHQQPARAASLYQPNAPILPSTKHLIVEGQPAHYFLYVLYGELDDSQLLVFPHPMWHSFDEPLAYVQRSVTPLVRTVTFVTLDPLIYGASKRAFIRLIQTSGLACFGILHRPPETPEQADALREVAPQMAGIMVLAEALVETLQQRFQLGNVSYLPLHPPFAKYATRDAGRIRSKIGVPEGHVVFSILGEARRGKGIDVLLQALDYVRRDDLQNMFFLIAGRSQHIDRNTIASGFLEKGVRHHIDLRSSDHPLKYAVLTEREFGEYVSASDVGLVLYQHEQRACMSGGAPNYVWGFKPLITFADSVIGRTVAQHELGIVVEAETPEAVALALTSALRLQRQGWKPAAAYNRYRAAIEPEAVLDRLAAILGDTRRRGTPRSSESEVLQREPSSEWPPELVEYVSNLPLLHSWDGGVTWNTGGFQAEHLVALYRFLKETLPAAPTLLETGAGNSTICLLLLNPIRLVSVAPDPDLFERIRSYCASHSISIDSLDARVSGSEWTLPQLALEMRDQPPCFDFALIDGSHNWPMVFVDFCYANYMLKAGGLIMIDDVQLHSVKELARMLSEHPDFRLELDLGKSLVFRRISESRTLSEWADIPYISRMSSQYAQSTNPYSLDAELTAVTSPMGR
jgi:GT2 family glycosyltransferase